MSARHPGDRLGRALQHELAHLLEGDGVTGHQTGLLAHQHA
jgi:hypothetical protein